MNYSTLLCILFAYKIAMWKMSSVYQCIHINFYVIKYVIKFVFAAKVVCHTTHSIVVQSNA